MSYIGRGDKYNLTQPDPSDENCLNKFIEELGSDITGACMIPINLPKKEVVNIINRAKKWFRKNYEYAVKTNYFYIPSTTFSSMYFRETRTIHLPTENTKTNLNPVFAVYGVYDTQRAYNSASGGLDQRFQSGADFSMNKLLFDDMYESGGLGESAKNLEYYIMTKKLLDQQRQLLEHPISFEYSRLTGELKFKGEDPRGDIILEVYEAIDDCSLFEDEAFFRYVSAKIKQSIGAKASVFKMNLPGNAEFSYKEIKEMGKEELDQVIEEIKSDEGLDWFFHT